MKKRIDNYKTVMVDVDDTLVLWNKSKYSSDQLINIKYRGRRSAVVPHTKNLNLVKKMWLLGYEIIVWSRTDSLWAETVSKALGIDKYVTLYLTKPLYYVDDKPCETWMGKKLWRSPK